MGADMTYKVIKDISAGDVKMVLGTYTNAGGSTGGVIATGLKEVFAFDSNCMTSQAVSVNKAAISGGAVTMTVVDGEDGQWKAIGV